MSRLYGCEKKIIGITGGIATGKSSFTAILKKNGYQVICADELVKEIYKLPKSITLVEEISPNLVTNNSINFSKLRELFFSDENIKRKIENYIYAQLENFFTKASKNLSSPILYDVPLLFEKKINEKIDATVLIYATRDQQIERLCRRDQVTNELANKILANQLPIDQKKKLANLVIDNSTTKDHLEENYQKIFLPFIKKY
tara:strand:+ start:15129 stop:15731 length:603 start_codon:yes stop_codon:yes gene_type:complete